ncbi:MAG TPA: hypothetical protein DDW52_02565 [Planctomycetaceae bacterium]|nr:hypothetical protein [Planctomycetaceae bacterium]
MLAVLAGCLSFGPALANEVDFRTEIRPLLNEHCVACHGGVKQAADLSFINEDTAAYVVEPGDAEASYMLERVLSDDPDEVMPPPEHGRKLNAAEVDLLRRWINQGARWQKHWAFDAPVRQAVPDVPSRYAAWGKSFIDAFVLKRMLDTGLEPNPAAAPERWLRRAALDVRGLPPTPAEREMFMAELKEVGDAAYGQAADRLLEDPGYGEKWATPWLDAVRYADSRGLGLDGRRTIWKYRDWVIDALNKDLPYDQFTIAQLAGDLLPNATMDDLLATAQNRLTQTNEEGGTDDEQFRVEAVIDRVNTTWQAWQGLSFGCVQCHSHPYDPIAHEEYYQFLAFFNNTTDSDLSEDFPVVRVPKDPRQYSSARELDQQIDAVWKTLWEKADQLNRSESTWHSPEHLHASTNNSTKVVVEATGEIPEYQTRGNVAKNTTVVLECKPPEGLTQITALKFWGLPENPDSAKLDSEWGFVVSHCKLEVRDANADEDAWREVKLQRVLSDEPFPLLDPMDSLNAKSSRGVGPYSRMHFPRSGVFILQDVLDLEQVADIRVSIAQNVFALGAFPLVAHRGRVLFSGDQAWLDWAKPEGVWKQLADLKNRRKKIESVATPVMQQRFATYHRPSAVFERGNYLTKSEVVRPKVPEFLGGEPEAKSDLSRLEMANWIADADNPLTARVAVNRVWGELFGTGIVSTQEDFGSAGAKPTHPALLDTLAVDFVTEMRWSQKALIRELILSQTYRQSAVASGEKIEADPGNRWLSRGPRNRLSAEVVRDQALAISGLLSDKRYGPPVHPPIPDGVWNPFQGGDKWKTPKKGDEDRYRRTVYTYTKRTIQFPISAAFDAPTREACTVRRLTSNTPLQSLMTLNDTLFVEAAEALAVRMEKHADSPERQIEYGFGLAVCRDPDEDEVTRLLKLYESLCDSEAVEQEIQQRFALQQLAMVLLNLDEVLNQ